MNNDIADAIGRMLEGAIRGAWVVRPTGATPALLNPETGKVDKLGFLVQVIVSSHPQLSHETICARAGMVVISGAETMGTKWSGTAVNILKECAERHQEVLADPGKAFDCSMNGVIAQSEWGLEE